MSATTADRTYNGWTNYETWCVNLWLNNDSDDYHYWRSEAEHCLRLAKHHGHEDAAFLLADRLKEHLWESKPEVSGMWADLLNSALDAVDWDSIAKAFLED